MAFFIKSSIVDKIARIEFLSILYNLLKIDEITSKKKYYIKTLNAKSINDDINEITNYGNTFDPVIGKFIARIIKIVEMYLW